MLQELDGNIVLAFQELRNPLFDAIAQFISFLGEKGWIFILTSIVMIIFKKTRSVGIILFATLFITGLTTEVLKEIVARPRPFVEYPQIQPLFDEDPIKSFPSGHTSMAFAFAGVIGYFYKRWRIWVYAFAILMALTRIYGGVHYLSDLIAGAAVGLACAFITIKVAEYIIKRRKREAN